MTRQANWLSDIEIDEISLVDRPANQHARVAIAKRAPEEDTVPELFNEKGEAVDVETLEIGDVVYDSDGQGFVMQEEDGEEEDAASDSAIVKEPAAVGKSLAEQVREDLSKAFSDVERDEVISKAMDQVSKAEARAGEAEAIAKSERDLRLTREYISKAAEYGVPGVTPEQLGPVLMRAAESLSFEDCKVLHKALVSGGEAFEELGVAGGGANHDAFGAVEALISGDTELSKALETAGTDRHSVIAKAFEQDPAAYDRYLADTQRG